MEDSFATYRDNSNLSEDVLTDDDSASAHSGSGAGGSFSENEDTLNSNESFKTPQESVVIPESSDEDEGESIIQAKKQNKAKVLRIESDSEDGAESIDLSRKQDKSKALILIESDSEEQFEKQHVLSPRTRRSITANIRLNSSSEEDEDHDDDPSDLFNRSYQMPETNKILSKPKKKNVIELSSDEDEIETSRNISSNENLRKSQGSPLVKSNLSYFDKSIVQKLSSTIQDKSQLYDIENKSLSIQSPPPVSYRSDDSNYISSTQASPEVELIKPSTSRNKLPVTSSRDLIQPKITTAIKQPFTYKTPKLVSQEFLNYEFRKLEEKKLDLITCKNLLKSNPNLPDGGKKIIERIENLGRDIKQHANEIADLVVDENETVSNRLSGSSKNDVASKPPLTWNELSEAVNSVQPRYTGKTGMANFAASKAMTVDRLKDIHQSLESCPNQSVLAEDPKGLKINLMEHQKHALAWIKWRESQKPRGGILADDMGLGKTLTMIAHVLAFKNERRNSSNKSDNCESSEEESYVSTNSASTQRRNDYKDGGTLVVCPASLMGQWENEVHSRVQRNILSVTIHHGNNRDVNPRYLVKNDIVVTTYNIVSREHVSNSAVFRIKWERIILDEAHVIRNHKTKTSIAVAALKGHYRWALTGTPIHNKEKDLYAVIKFLKCSPFDDLSHWQKWIDNKTAGGMQRLQTLIGSMMIRRTKIQLQEKGELECLPEKSLTLFTVDLEKDEMNVYQKVMIYSQSLFSQFLQQKAERDGDFVSMAGKNKFSNMHKKVARLFGSEEVKTFQILVLLLRLRQICVHTGLIDAMLHDDDLSGCDNTSADNSGLNLVQHLENLAITDENSVEAFDNFDSSNNPTLSKASSNLLKKSNPVFNLNRASSKIKKIIEILEEKVLCTTDKAIIISQWTGVLNIMEKHLSQKQITCCALNGSVPIKDRNNIVTKFNDPESEFKVMLLSLTAGGVGLNLVGANHLFLMDLHWNPQLEAQAQDRIYRVGQKKNVHIYKFVCKDTIEERIKKLQDTKLAIANGILTGEKGGTKLTIEDLKSLFGV